MVRMTGKHTFLVVLSEGYLEYTQYEPRWDERKGQRESVCIFRRSVSYNNVVWC